MIGEATIPYSLGTKNRLLDTALKTLDRFIEKASGISPGEKYMCNHSPLEIVEETSLLAPLADIYSGSPEELGKNGAAVKEMKFLECNIDDGGIYDPGKPGDEQGEENLESGEDTAGKGQKSSLRNGEIKQILIKNTTLNTLTIIEERPFRR